MYRIVVTNMRIVPIPDNRDSSVTYVRYLLINHRTRLIMGQHNTGVSRGNLLEYNTRNHTTQSTYNQLRKPGHSLSSHH